MPISPLRSGDQPQEEAKPNGRREKGFMASACLWVELLPQGPQTCFRLVHRISDQADIILIAVLRSEGG